MVESKSRLLLTVYLAAASVVAASSVVYHHHESMPSDIYNADDDSPTTSTTPVVLLGVEATLNTSTHISDNGATRTELPEDVATRKASSEEATNVNGDVVVDVECGVWLALSTLEGAGLGMYAGVNFVKGQDLLIGGDSVIAITDIKQHNSNQDFTGDFLWDEYTWNAEALKMDLEGHVEVNVASEGFGAAANSFLPLYNVEEWYPRNTDIGLHRSKDAGAGASTVFHHRKSTANKDIAAGSELYVSCKLLSVLLEPNDSRSKCLAT